MFVAIFYDTDGYTYGCELVLGVYRTRPEADERCLKWVEEHARRANALENARVEQLDFGDWDL